MRWKRAQGLDGLMTKLTACEKKARWLISQYAILYHCCPYPPAAPLHVGSLSSFPSRLPPLPLHSCISPISLLWAPHCPIPHYPLQPNALFSLNALFLLTSCLHPSQWLCITPGRIIALGLSISSVAPYPALCALSIYGVSPFAASHLPTVQ